MKTLPRIRSSIYSCLLLGAFSFLSCYESCADTVTSQPASQPASFIPLDSLPNFADFQLVAFQHLDDFTRILPAFVQDGYDDIPNTVGQVLSDHQVTWGDYANCLNSSAATIYSSATPDITKYHLWTPDMQTYITRTTISRQITGSPFSTTVFSYDVVPEYANEPALLPADTSRRYTNWRNVHYWLYHQLQQEELLLNGSTLNQEADDQITTYFKTKYLYPPINPICSIDNVDAILQASTEIGCFFFSDDGSTVKSINLNALFFLPTLAEKTAWDAQYGGQFPMQNSAWTTDSLTSDLGSLATIQLAANKSSMMRAANATVDETNIQTLAQNIQQNIDTLRCSDAYQQADVNEKAIFEKILCYTVAAINTYSALYDIAALISPYCIDVGFTYTGGFFCIKDLIGKGYFMRTELLDAGFDLSAIVVKNKANPITWTIDWAKQTALDGNTSGSVNAEERLASLVSTYYKKTGYEWTALFKGGLTWFLIYYGSSIDTTY